MIVLVVKCTHQIKSDGWVVKPLTSERNVNGWIIIHIDVHHLHMGNVATWPRYRKKNEHWWVTRTKDEGEKMQQYFLWKDLGMRRSLDDTKHFPYQGVKHGFPVGNSMRFFSFVHLCPEWSNQSNIVFTIPVPKWSRTT